MSSVSDKEDGQVPVIEQVGLVTPVGDRGTKRGRHNAAGSNVPSP